MEWNWDKTKNTFPYWLAVKANHRKPIICNQILCQRFILDSSMC